MILGAGVGWLLSGRACDSGRPCSATGAFRPLCVRRGQLQDQHAPLDRNSSQASEPYVEIESQRLGSHAGDFQCLLLARYTHLPRGCGSGGFALGASSISLPGSG